MIFNRYSIWTVSVPVPLYSFLTDSLGISHTDNESISEHVSYSHPSCTQSMAIPSNELSLKIVLRIDIESMHYWLLWLYDALFYSHVKYSWIAIIWFHYMLSSSFMFVFVLDVYIQSVHIGTIELIRNACVADKSVFFSRHFCFRIFYSMCAWKTVMTRMGDRKGELRRTTREYHNLCIPMYRLAR